MVRNSGPVALNKINMSHENIGLEGLDGQTPSVASFGFAYFSETNPHIFRSSFDVLFGLTRPRF